MTASLMIGAAVSLFTDNGWRVELKFAECDFAGGMVSRGKGLPQGQVGIESRVKRL